MGSDMGTMLESGMGSDMNRSEIKCGIEPRDSCEKLF